MADFSNQLNRLSEVLLHYLHPLFMAVQRDPTLQVRGCFFLSTTQHSNIFDLLFDHRMGLTLKPSEQKLPMLLQSKAYFVRGFFQNLGVATVRSYVAAEKPVLPRRPFVWPRLTKTWMRVVLAVGILLGVALMGIWFGAKQHIYSTLAKDPALAYHILTGNDVMQNLNAFISYEDRWLPKELQVSLAKDTAIHAAVEANAKTYLNQQWQEEVYQYYQQNIAGRFPLEVTAKQEITLNQFNAFYAPQGKLIDFDQRYLQPKAIQQLLVKDQALITLYQRLKRLHYLLYRNNVLGFSFMVYPNTFSADVKGVNVMVAGIKLNLLPNGLSAGTFAWPNTQGVQQSGFTIMYQQLPQETVLFSGEWSWLRFFNTLHWQIADSENDYIVSPHNAPFSLQLNAQQPLAEAITLFPQLSVPKVL